MGGEHLEIRIPLKAPSERTLQGGGDYLTFSIHCKILRPVIYGFTSYNHYLEHTLRERKKVNPAYSLRAMAKQIGIAPSTLSDVIAGKKDFSEPTALHVANRLKLTGKGSRYFCTLVRYQTTRNEELRSLLASQLRALNPKLREHFTITVDRFKLMTEWYHAAIVEMTFLENFPMNEESIAHSLSISPTQAREALSLLLRLKLLEPARQDRYRKTQSQSQFQVQSEVPNQALRKFHHQMLAMAQASLETQLPSEKVIGSETLPIAFSDLPEAREIIENCFQQMIGLSKRSSKKEQVYHLGIQFFRLTRRSEK